MRKIALDIQKVPTNKLMRGTLVVLAGLLLVSCRETAGSTAPSQGQDLFLGIIAFFLFLGTLVYAAYRTFSRADDRSTEIEKAEFRARAAAFVIGILVTIIIIAADTAGRGTFSIMSLFAVIPWYFLTVLGAGLGFLVALASFAISNYRVTDGYEFVILTVTICGSLGMYLAFYGTGLRHNILAGLLSILVGLLVFRMLFPIRPEAKPVQKT